MNIRNIFIAILLFAACMALQSCARSSGYLLKETEIGMSKTEVVKSFLSPTKIHEPVTNFYGESIELWEYEYNHFYFLNDTVVLKEYSHETWPEAKEKIYRTEFRKIAEERKDGKELFRIGLGVGGGGTAAVCEECMESALTAQLSGRARVMIKINDEWWVGAQPFFSGKGGDVYEHHGEDWRSNNTYWTHLMLITDYYPIKKFFFELGGGVSIYNTYDQHISTRPNYPTLVHGEGFGIIAGVGYDFRISKDFVLTPTASYFHSFLTDVDLNSYKVLYDRKNLNEFDMSVTICFTPRM